MELELDLKITKDIDDLQITDFRIAKNRAGPVFLSREIATKFVLIAHLRGYKKEDIKIDINEDGTLISISGEKMVQEMEMNGWVMHKEESNLNDFIKVFKIPKGVDLDQIEAKYNDDESTLTIYMPKKNKRIIGGRIEEVKDEKNQVDDDNLAILQMEQVNSSDQQNEKEEIRNETETEQLISKLGEKIYNEEASTREEGRSINSHSGKTEEILEEKIQGACNAEQGQKCDEDETSYDQHELVEERNNNKFKLCAPCFFIGSTLVASLVALFIRLVRSKMK